MKEFPVKTLPILTRKMTDSTEKTLLELATEFPHSYEVVKDVFDVVKDFELTRNILKFSSQRAISVYPILCIIGRK